MGQIQRIILKNKNKIALICGILATVGYIAHQVARNVTSLSASAHNIAYWTFIGASVIGIVPIAIQAFQSVKVKVISIDVLVTIAVLGALYIKNYEESAIVSFLFLFGAYLEQRTLNSTRSAIKELTEMAPESALKRMENGEFEEVMIDDVEPDDILLVKTGAKVPVDGRVISGAGYVNEASITGEPKPAEKETGSGVFAGTILENGTLQIAAERVGEDTTFGKIIELVEEAQDSKSKVERFIDKFARYYTPAVLALGAVVWLISRDLELAITILVLGCPGALVIGVPISNVAGIGNGAKNGILLKGSEVIHNFSRIDTIVFDKTGTLTQGRPEVSDIIKYSDNSDLALAYLACLEAESDHPLAHAIVARLGQHGQYTVENTTVIKGGGLSATVDNHIVIAGNAGLIEGSGITIGGDILADIKRLEESGSSIVITAVDGKIEALIGVRDMLRPESHDTLKKLGKMGVQDLIVLSGDNPRTVDIITHGLPLTAAHGNMLPADKSSFIADLQAKGRKVVFVGDGVNDSPSLALADIGIAMGGGTDVAIETSDVVLMNSNLARLPHALGLAKATARNMRQNMFIAIGTVFFLLGGVFFSDWMNMSVGMFVHEGSIMVVILNGMRLLYYKLRR